jgi:hypothetical protein
MIPYFRRLGEQIEKDWIQRSYDEEIFPQLAREALEQAPPDQHVGVEEIVDWTFGPAQEFRQPHHATFFGEPPVLLFQAPRFYIEALFWLSDHLHP